jgi:hypothetical protein
MRSKLGVLLVAGLLHLLGTGPASAQVDFETYPNTTDFQMFPRDDWVVSTQYQDRFGVSFALDIDGDGFPDPGAYPILEQTGQQDPNLVCAIPVDSYTCGTNCTGSPVCDTEAIGFEGQLGEFFLRLPPPNTANALIIVYTGLVASTQFELWDIDFGETWNVEAFGDEYVRSNDDTSPVNVPVILAGGDGQPQVYNLTTPSPSIRVVRVTYTAGPPNPGLAFDNFSPSLGSNWSFQPADPIAWWPGGLESSDTTFISDFAPFFGPFILDPVGTYVSPSVIDSVTGAGSLGFSGTNHFESPSPNPQLKALAQSQFSVDLWIRTTASGRMPIVEVSDGALTPTGFRLDVETDAGTGGDEDRLHLLVCSPACFWASSVKVDDVLTGVRLNDGGKHHLGVTFDSPGTARFFVDGQELGLVTAVPGVALGGSNLLLVGKSQVGPTFFTGFMDDLEIFGSLLSAFQMMTAANAGSSGRCVGDTFATFVGTAGCDGCEVNFELAPCVDCSCGTERDCRVTLTTTLGQTASDMALQVAAAINASSDLASQGISAIASGPTVDVPGGSVVGARSTDPTLEVLIEPVVIPVPSLSPAAIALLCVVLAASAGRPLARGPLAPRRRNGAENRT